MRDLLRALGLVSIGLGLILYFAKRQENVQPIIASAPQRAPVLSPAHKQVTTHPAAKTAPKPNTLSTIKLVHDEPLDRAFVIHLFKQDGWFDTGIPISNGLMVFLSCSFEQVGQLSNTRFVKAMIGNASIYPPAMHPEVTSIRLVTITSDNDPRKGPSGDATQYLIVPGNSVSRLKLKIFPDTAPDDLQYRVHLQIIPDQQNQLTTAQQNEVQELEKWGPR